MHVTGIIKPKQMTVDCKYEQNRQVQRGQLLLLQGVSLLSRLDPFLNIQCQALSLRFGR